MRIRKIRFTCLAGMVAALVAGATAAHAEQPSYAELAERLAQLESQMEAQSIGLVSYQQFGGSGSGCTDCDYGPQNGHCACSTGCGCPPVTCRAPAWYAGYELTFLQAHVSIPVILPGGWDDEYGAGNRFILGYDHGNGIGARLRFWMFNHGLDAELVPLGVGIDMDVADAEITLQNRLSSWDVLLSGGVRYARTEFSAGPTELYFEGTGPTVSLEARRDIGRRGFYLVGNLRTSFLVGETHTNFLFPDVDLDGDSMFVLENQLGMGWSREVGIGELNLRGVWETQDWQNINNVSTANIPKDLTLTGPTFSVELRY